VARPAYAWVALLLLWTAAARGETANELLSRTFENLYAEDYVQTLVLATQVREGTEMQKKLQILRRQSVRPGKALLRFLYPQTIRKTSVLVIENDEGNDDLYVYLPGIQITRRLSAAQRADSFFGTDLSYEDVEPKHGRDYEAERIGEDVVAGLPCELIEFRTREGLETAYEKTIACIERERAVMLRMQFYRHGKIEKTLHVDASQVKRIGERHIPFLMTIETPRRRSRTRVITESYEQRSEIPDQLFSIVNLNAGDARADRRKSNKHDSNGAESTNEAEEATPSGNQSDEAGPSSESSSSH
jgi:hypothetical protein